MLMDANAGMDIGIGGKIVVAVAQLSLDTAGHIRLSICDDDLAGKLTDKRFLKLSQQHETKQEQLECEMKQQTTNKFYMNLY